MEIGKSRELEYEVERLGRKYPFPLGLHQNLEDMNSFCLNREELILDGLKTRPFEDTLKFIIDI